MRYSGSKQLRCGMVNESPYLLLFRIKIDFLLMFSSGFHCSSVFSVFTVFLGEIHDHWCLLPNRKGKQAIPTVDFPPWPSLATRDICHSHQPVLLRPTGHQTLRGGETTRTPKTRPCVLQQPSVAVLSDTTG